MAEMNWYHIYYQTHRRVPPGVEVTKVLKDRAVTPTDKMQAFYRNLLSFLREKGRDVSIFARQRSKQDMFTFIRGMKTILRQSGWNDEFYTKYYGKDDAEIEV